MCVNKEQQMCVRHRHLWHWHDADAWKNKRHTKKHRLKNSLISITKQLKAFIHIENVLDSLHKKTYFCLNGSPCARSSAHCETSQTQKAYLLIGFTVLKLHRLWAKSGHRKRSGIVDVKRKKEKERQRENGSRSNKIVLYLVTTGNPH